MAQKRPEISGTKVLNLSHMGYLGYMRHIGIIYVGVCRQTGYRIMCIYVYVYIYKQGLWENGKEYENYKLRVHSLGRLLQHCKSKRKLKHNEMEAVII